MRSMYLYNMITYCFVQLGHSPMRFAATNLVIAFSRSKRVANSDDCTTRVLANAQKSLTAVSSFFKYMSGEGKTGLNSDREKTIISAPSQNAMFLQLLDTGSRGGSPFLILSASSSGTRTSARRVHWEERKDLLEF